jgi:hypothetical protein
LKGVDEEKNVVEVINVGFVVVYKWEFFIFGELTIPMDYLHHK